MWLCELSLEPAKLLEPGEELGLPLPGLRDERGALSS